ncbi:MAG: ADP-ribosylglycohydrolase family protein, partial [Muribaculaceae bacterium]|nr:ADP-ribosylglycohydrolase family protein [Muribaculaceae bacterium]
MSIPNRLAGCLYGYAIGNALGLGTEFMTRNEISVRYPNGLHNYSDIIRDSYRSSWQRGAYTNDTELMLLLVDSILDNDRYDYHDYAQRLKDWFENTSTANLDHEMRWILSNDTYTESPHEVAQYVHDQQHLPIASNEHLGRALIIGLWGGEDMHQNVLDDCNLTNSDPLCHATSLIIAHMAHELLWHRREASYEHLWGVCQGIEPRIIPFLEAARDGRIEDLDLDNEDTYMSTLKAMSVALWALWHYKDPMEALNRVIHE